MIGQSHQCDLRDDTFWYCASDLNLDLSLHLSNLFIESFNFLVHTHRFFNTFMRCVSLLICRFFTFGISLWHIWNKEGILGAHFYDLSYHFIEGVDEFCVDHEIFLHIEQERETIIRGVAFSLSKLGKAFLVNA